MAVTKKGERNLRNAKLEFVCLSDLVKLVALVLYCLDSTQPAKLPR